MREGQPGGWLSEGFCHPELVQLDCGMHLRPIRASDVGIDYPAVMGSRERLWDKYGEAWGWPPATMTPEQDRDDLVHHEREMAAREAFNYAILDTDESHLLGCIYLDRPGHEIGCDVVVSWWVVDTRVGSTLESELNRFVPAWVTTDWPFTKPLFAP
jgi:hypothetical protein